MATAALRRWPPEMDHVEASAEMCSSWEETAKLGWVATSWCNRAPAAVHPVVGSCSPRDLKHELPGLATCESPQAPLLTGRLETSSCKVEPVSVESLEESKLLPDSLLL